MSVSGGGVDKGGRGVRPERQGDAVMQKMAIGLALFGALLMALPAAAQTGEIRIFFGRQAYR